jgi:CheY-like chemotaxis protein
MTNATPRNTVSGPRGLPLTVLIADDSAPVADMLTEILTSPGRIEVIGLADSEASAIEAVGRLKPDVIVLDMQLRTGSGANVIRALRADAQLGSARVIVMSNHTAPQLKAACLELGADDYFDKVKELGLLTRRIGELAQRKEKEGL